MVGRSDNASLRSSPFQRSKVKPHDSEVNGRSKKRRSPAAQEGQDKGRNRSRGQSPSLQLGTLRVYKVQYRVYLSSKSGVKWCLVDRGANGCIIGSDMTIVSRTNKFIDLTGIEDHTVRELNIVHARSFYFTHVKFLIAVSD